MYPFLKVLGITILIAGLVVLGLYLLASSNPSFFFQNISYKTHTQLRGYVLTDEQIVEAGNFFAVNEQFSPQQLSFNELNRHKKNFIVILAKNIGNKQASGMMKCTVGQRSVEVSVIGLRPHMKESDVWIVPVGSAILGSGPNQPQTSVKWTKLYVK